MVRIANVDLRTAVNAVADKISFTEKGAVNGVAPLDSNAKIAEVFLDLQNVMDAIAEKISLTEKGAANGVAPLDSNSKVAETFLDLTNVMNAIAGKIGLTEKGAANGVAPLGSNAKIAEAYLDAEIMEYKGSWNATTNTPTLVNGVGSLGNMYSVSGAGTQFSEYFAVGDHVFYEGTQWMKVCGSRLNISSANTNLVITGTEDNCLLTIAANPTFTTVTSSSPATSANHCFRKVEFDAKYVKRNANCLSDAQISCIGSVPSISFALTTSIEPVYGGMSVTLDGVEAGWKNMIVFRNQMNTGIFVDGGPRLYYLCIQLTGASWNGAITDHIMTGVCNQQFLMRTGTIITADNNVYSSLPYGYPKGCALAIQYVGAEARTWTSNTGNVMTRTGPYMGGVFAANDYLVMYCDGTYVRSDWYSSTRVLKSSSFFTNSFSNSYEPLFKSGQSHFFVTPYQRSAGYAFTVIPQTFMTANAWSPVTNGVNYYQD